MERNPNYEKFFDVDLPYGEIGEKKLKEIFGDKKIEVKTEREIWVRTNNICIELFCRGEPSGFNITKADYWCHIFPFNKKIKFILLFPVEELKQIVKTKNKELKYIGADNESLCALIPLSEVLI